MMHSHYMSCYAKALNAKAAGAKAVLAYQEQSEDYFWVEPGDWTMDETIPVGTISRRIAQLLNTYSLVRSALA